jgi:hypothetical protein
MCSMSSAQAELLNAIEAEWPKTVQDAGLSDETLFLCHTDHSPARLRESPAQWFPPELEAKELDDFPREHREKADSESMWERHRIVVRLSYDYPSGLKLDTTQALVGAVLRHELEHACQHEDCPALYGLIFEVVLPVLSQAFGGACPNTIINCMPNELDANAAAARYLRVHHPRHIAAIRATIWPDLTQMQPNPQSTSTLFSRMVAFLYLFREAAEQWAHPGSFGDSIEWKSEEAAAVWGRLAALQKGSSPSGRAEFRPEPDD